MIWLTVVPNSCWPLVTISTGLSLRGLTGGLRLSRTWQRNLWARSHNKNDFYLVTLVWILSSLIVIQTLQLIPVFHDLGFLYFFPKLCKFLWAIIVHLSSHNQESVLRGSLRACTTISNTDSCVVMYHKHASLKKKRSTNWNIKTSN